MSKPIEVKSAYFIRANGERVELSNVALPVVSDSTPDNSFTAFRIQGTAEVTLTFQLTEWDMLRLLRVFAPSLWAAVLRDKWRKSKQN